MHQANCFNQFNGRQMKVIPTNRTRKIMETYGVTQGSNKTKAFTLVELLVTITIVGILSAILLPVLSRAKISAQCVVSRNNLKQIAALWTEYAHDNGRMMPYDGKNSNSQWAAYMASSLPPMALISPRSFPPSGKPKKNPPEDEDPIGMGSKKTSWRAFGTTNVLTEVAVQVPVWVPYQVAISFRVKVPGSAYQVTVRHRVRVIIPGSQYSETVAITNRIKLQVPVQTTIGTRVVAFGLTGSGKGAPALTRTTKYKYIEKNVIRYVTRTRYRYKVRTFVTKETRYRWQTQIKYKTRYRKEYETKYITKLVKKRSDELVSSSYSINAWAQEWNPLAESNWEKFYTTWESGSSETPIFTEGICPDVMPRPTDKAPSNLLGQNAGMSRICINRYGNQANNVAFFDGSVRSVELPDLWKLPWYQGWQAPSRSPMMPMD